MKSCLVVFYSLTGTTRNIAEIIAAEYGCELEAICDARPRMGWRGNLRAIFEAVTRRPAAILPPQRDPADYGLVVLGTPVWAGGMSSPMRSYLADNKDRFRQVAAFCTMRGSGGDKALDEIARLYGKGLQARLILTGEQIGNGQHRERLAGFVRSLAQRPVS